MPGTPAHGGSGRSFRSLRTAREFDRVFQEGRRYRRGPFTLVILPREDRFAVGFKIGRRTGKAVVRNRIRRRFRALFERFAPLPGRGADVVVLAQAACRDLPFAELERRVTPLLAQAGVVPRQELP